MKKKLIVAAVALASSSFAFAAPAAVANDAGIYVGANVGSSDQKFEVDGLGSATKHETGGKLLAGYQINKYVAGEVGYVNFGKISESATDGVDTVKASIKTESFYLAAVGTLPVASQFSLFGKVGVATNHTSASVELNGAKASGSKDKTTGIWGVGAKFDITKNVAAVLEYEDFGKVYDEDGYSLKQKLTSVGIRYKF